MPEITHAEWLKLKTLSTNELKELATIIEAILVDRAAENAGYCEPVLEHWDHI